MSICKDCMSKKKCTMVTKDKKVCGYFYSKLRLAEVENERKSDK